MKEVLVDKLSKSQLAEILQELIWEMGYRIIESDDPVYQYVLEKVEK